MPIYLKTIGFSIVLIGVLEGFAEATAGLSKGYFGNLSDKTGTRLPFIQMGYLLSAISKPMMALFTYPLWIFFARTIDRLGKGIRTGARDALLSDEATPDTKGRVFGFHRSMDTFGAVLWPSLALIYLAYRPDDYKTLFYIAFFPGLISIGFTFLVKERRVYNRESLQQSKIGWLDFLNYWRTSPPLYRKLSTALLVFTLFNSSDVFLLLKIKEAGLGDTSAIGAYIFYNLIYAISSYPLGSLADKIGMKLMVFGAISHSLALIADAGHNLSDVLGLLLAWAASYLVERPPDRKYTYGLRRSSILAALLNAILLLLAMGGIAWEAIRRLSDPSPVAGGTVILVAGIGVLINTITALLFMLGRERDLNIRGAFLHMAADALVSVGVVLAGIAILQTGWLWLDPVISLIVVVVIVFGTWNLFREALELILDGVPKQIEPIAVRTFLEELPGVTRVHDLHIWAMSTTETALTAHLVMPEACVSDRFLTDTSASLQTYFGIEEGCHEL